MSSSKGRSGGQRLSQVIHFPVQKVPLPEQSQPSALAQRDLGTSLEEMTRWVANAGRTVRLYNVCTVLSRERDGSATVSFWKEGVDRQSPTWRSQLPAGLHIYDISLQGTVLLEAPRAVLPRLPSRTLTDGLPNHIMTMSLTGGWMASIPQAFPCTDARLAAGGSILLALKKPSTIDDREAALQWYTLQRAHNLQQGAPAEAEWRHDVAVSRPASVNEAFFHLLGVSPSGRWVALAPERRIGPGAWTPGDPFSLQSQQIHLIDRDASTVRWHILESVQRLGLGSALPIAFSPDSQRLILGGWRAKAPTNSLTIVDLNRLAEDGRASPKAMSTLKSIDSLFDDARYRAIVQLAVSPDGQWVDVLMRSADIASQIFNERYALDEGQRRAGHSEPVGGNPQDVQFTLDGNAVVIGATDYRGNYVLYRHLLQRGFSLSAR